MGLMQRAAETYDANVSLVGVYREGHEPLAPIGHKLTNADIEITLDQTGGFLSAVITEKEDCKTIIPVTEDSEARAGKYLPPHPLCEQLCYLAPYDANKHTEYLENLQAWMESDSPHPFLAPIFRYVESGRIMADLAGTGILNSDINNDKLLVRWRVVGFENEEPACWKNQNLFQAFIRYYLTGVSHQDPALCMITGEQAVSSTKHPKGIISINGNAKLISSNDTSGFTYRGRFREDWQAATVGYIASQKAHNAIRWLASEQGVRDFSGNRVFLCWNPQGTKIPRPMRRLRETGAEPLRQPSDYKQALKSTLMSFRKDNQIKGTETAVLAAFDAATTGRLALTYYNEVSINLFLARMEAWDARCCWFNGSYGIQAPDLLRLVECAFGTQRKDALEVDDRIQRQHLQRLLNAKVSGGIIPVDIVKALSQRASAPQNYDDKSWRKIVFTACAALQKYRFDTNQGGNEMAWELDKRDRSFQFGRLLAVLERGEEDYYRKTQEARQTNAVKFMSEFRQRPWFVFERINRQLHQAYLGRIEPWQVSRYQRLVGEITAILGQFPEEELNRPLEDIYLMGYELQRNAFFKKEDNNDNETEE